MNRRWPRAMLWLLALCASGCFAGRLAPVILSEKEVPVLLRKGQTVVIPWDGYLMEAGTLLRCERRCLNDAMGMIPP